VVPPGAGEPDLALDPIVTREALDEPILALYDAFRAPVRFEPADLRVAYRGDEAAGRALAAAAAARRRGAALERAAATWAATTGWWTAASR
jgi:hypothetical protein